eukprot:349932-Chlamydomonas_euryale.AAC.12
MRSHGVSCAEPIPAGLAALKALMDETRGQALSGRWKPAADALTAPPASFAFECARWQGGHGFTCQLTVCAAGKEQGNQGLGMLF